MSEIFTEKDIRLVLSKYYELGEISASEKAVIKKTVCEIIMHKDLIKYYSPKYISYNEREIIDVNGKSFIPDRIVFLDKKNIVLIDYKTGTKKNRHVEQLKIYESKLKLMGFKTVKKIIIYVSEKIEIKSF